MDLDHSNKIILRLSFALSILTIFASCVGLFTPNFYSAESLNWQAQSLGQDMIDLFLITPCLLVTSYLSYKNNKTAFLIWGGVVTYLSYTFVLYCFEVHFNKLFIVYCLCLGLSFYSLLYFLFMQLKDNISISIENKLVTRVIGLYFIMIAVLFYFLWLSEIIPSIVRNDIPKSISDTGLFTNGVQVLDLSILLPAIFITGVLLLKEISFGLILTPLFLSFFVLMDITIGVLAVVMKVKGVESDLMLTAIMGVLSLVSSSLLVWYFKSIKKSAEL